MNKTVWTIHLENTALRDELKQARKRLRLLEAAPRCAYCGYPCPKGQRVCAAHRDLPACDPGFAARTDQVAA